MCVFVFFLVSYWPLAHFEGACFSGGGAAPVGGGSAPVGRTVKREYTVTVGGDGEPSGSSGPSSGHQSVISEQPTLQSDPS